MSSEFSSTPPPNLSAAAGVMSVSMLNQSVARLLENQIPLCWISGEVSNFTRAASGHWYFTLKDDGAQVRAVMFRGRAQYAGFQPRDGDRLEVRAHVTLYAPRGDYQLNIEAIRRAGVGNLHEAFLQLKEKLARQGLFDAQYKRALPLFPRTIGIITSPQAAALRDVLSTFARRSPHLQLILYPVPVQGAGAAEKIAQMLTLAGQQGACDLLILCRGGGSIEDLWCFNEELLARAIAACPLPIISGVGHETDFTIADFVADLRAPTPTAAAELACMARQDWLARLEQQAMRLQRACTRLLNTRGQQLDYLSRRLPSPAALLKREQLRVQALQARLQHASQRGNGNARHRLVQLQTRLQAQLPDTRMARAQLAGLARRLAQAHLRQQSQQIARLSALTAQLELLNPQRTLERGYAIVTTASGQIVRQSTQLVEQQALQLRVAQGSAQFTISDLRIAAKPEPTPEPTPRRAQ